MTLHSSESACNREHGKKKYRPKKPSKHTVQGKKTKRDDDDDEVVTRKDSDFFGDHTDRLKIKEKKSQTNTVWEKKR